MRVLLVLPPASLQPPLTRPRHAPHYTAIVAAALREAGHDVLLQDQTLHTRDLGRVVADAAAARADVLLLAHSDYNREFDTALLQAVSQALRDGLPDTPLWGFGRLAKDPASKALATLPALDGMLWDEPEFAAVALADGAERPPGSMRLMDGALQVQEPASDLARSPVPAWDLVAMERYGFSPHQSGGSLVYPVLASRGCPFPCFWCEVRQRPPWRARPVGAVIDELRVLHERYGATSFFIADPTFGIDREQALEFCRRLPSEGPPGIRWSCMSRTDRVDLELLRAMKAAGCWNVLFGVESLERAVLERSRKNLDPDTVGPAIAAAKEAGLEVIVSAMIGLPGDSPAGVERTVDKLIAAEPDFAQFFVVQIGEDEAPEQTEVLSGFDGSRFEFWGHVVAPRSFGDRDRLLALRRRSFRRFYLRPGYLLGRVRALARSREPVAELLRAGRGGLLAVRLAAGARAD